MKPVFSVAQIRHIETACALATNILMQRAAQAISLWLQRQLQAEQKVLFLAGAGHNGGDALHAALNLAIAQADVEITVWLTASPEQCVALTQQAYLKIEQTQCPNLALKIIASENDVPPAPDVDWIVDGLFGSGLSRPMTGVAARLVHLANRLAAEGARILAIDVPSGLHADHGQLLQTRPPPSADLERQNRAQPVSDCYPMAICAHHTLTMIGLKPGLYMVDGRDFAGEIHLAKLDMPKTAFPEPQAYLNDPEFFHTALPRRLHNSHKGCYGKLAIIGGNSGMIGAALLSARAALFSGAGKIIVGLLAKPVEAVDWLYPELMLTSAETLELAECQVVLIGPGMGKVTEPFLEDVLQQAAPCVVDADAINQIADSGKLFELLCQRRQNQYTTVLTPHPLEAARLLHTSVASIQEARMSAAQKLAHTTGATVVLKGSGTVICEANHATLINPTGNGALASAGTGDVLAGVIAALVAQELSGYVAASAAVWLHGQAADDLVMTENGPIGLNASALLTAIRARLNLISLSAFA